MKSYEKEIQQALLTDEKVIIKQLKQVYEKANKDIEEKIALLLGRNDKENLQSIIYQVEYQQALKTQINTILEQLNTNQFTSISEYLTKCYENGYVSAMYSIHKQGIPIMSPINQEQVVKALQLDTKLSGGLYKALGEDVNLLKRKIRAQISRGIVNGYSYDKMAKELANYTKIGYNKAVRITRTEGHRIQNQSVMDASHIAKDKGADILKQWDATLDSRTRESHTKVDGEIKELDEEFSNGLRFPGDPGGCAAEVVNCRCALLQRARWALDEDELETLKERAEFYGLDKTEQFEDFKQKYLSAVDNATKSGKIESGAISGAYNNKNDPDGSKRDAHAKLYYDELRNSDKDIIVNTISKNTNIDSETVSKMYDHILVNKYNLIKGKTSFDPSYDMAESLRRLREGKNILEHDLLLIRHEAMEYDLMNIAGLSYEEAHSITNKTYNYEQALIKWLKDER